MRMSMADAINLAENKLQEFTNGGEDNKVSHVQDVLTCLHDLDHIGIEEIPYGIADNPGMLDEMYAHAEQGTLKEFWKDNEDY